MMKNFTNRWRLLFIFFVLLAGCFLVVVEALGNSSFAQWIEDFYPVAKKEGISRATWDKAFSGVKEPDGLVLEKARYQPEFTTEIWDYLDGRVNSLAIDEGRRMARVYSGTLGSVEAKFGVEQSVLLAIWSMESNYGTVLDQPKRLHYVPRALATLGYGDPKRTKFARKQLVAALKILQAGDIAADQMTGSWAGAMGHTQFIPTSYLAYGVDMDGNGRRDIWNSIPDALATAANLLKKNGWRTGKTWGYEVILPASGLRYKDQTRTLAEWQKLGFKRPGSKGFPRPAERAELKILAGADGPGFLMMKNFFVLKRYNNANAYALGVGLLADRLAGYNGLVQPWPRPPGSLTVDEKIELQQRLQQKGYYSGKIDGYLGDGTREAIRKFLVESGLKGDGEPSKTALQVLR